MWVSGTLGVSAVATAVLTPDSGGNSVATSIVDIISGLQEKDQVKVSAAVQSIPGRLTSSVLSGEWILPALGAFATGWASRKFKI
jgi:hypothetical protein